MVKMAEPKWMRRLDVRGEGGFWLVSKLAELVAAANFRKLAQEAFQCSMWAHAPLHQLSHRRANISYIYTNIFYMYPIYSRFILTITKGLTYSIYLNSKYAISNVQCGPTLRCTNSHTGGPIYPISYVPNVFQIYHSYQTRPNIFYVS